MFCFVLSRVFGAVTVRDVTDETSLEAHEHLRLAAVVFAGHAADHQALQADEIDAHKSAPRREALARPRLGPVRPRGGPEE